MQIEGPQRFSRLLYFLVFFVCLFVSFFICSSQTKPTSHVGESAVKVRPNRETREVELYTKTAVWKDFMKERMILLTFDIQALYDISMTN